MNREQIKDWADFYGRLVFVSAWNGILRFLFVFTGGALATQSGLTDLRALPWSGVFWTLAGTILASIASELYRHPLPAPKEPTP